MPSKGELKPRLGRFMVPRIYVYGVEKDVGVY